MSKTLTAGMDAHLLLEVTSLATCWRLTRTDGTEFFFTDHDQDVTFEGDTYKAETGYSRTAIQNDATLAVDNLDIEGVFDSAEITETDLRAGLFDFAQIRIFVINWDDLTDGAVKMRNGKLGEVVLTEQGVFRAELRGLTQALSQSIGEVYQPECRADLGDSRCKVPVDPPLVAAQPAYSLGAFVKASTAGGSTQEQFENRIYEATTAGTTGKTEPTFDTTVSNTTVWDIEAEGVLTFGANPLDTETVTIDAKVYTFQTVLTNVDGNVLIGADASASLDNLVAAIVLGSGSGTTYAALTTLHPTVSASAGPGDTMDAIAKTGGTGGNSIDTTETVTNGSWADATLTGGAVGVTFTARQAWMRHGVVDTVTDRKVFTLKVAFDEVRAIDGWFDQGAVIFEDGTNTGRVIEIRGWTSATRQLTLFLPASFVVASDTKVKLYPGCDKRSATCIAKFAMPGTTLFANGNIKNFRGEPFVPGQDEMLRTPDAKSA